MEVTAVLLVRYGHELLELKKGSNSGTPSIRSLVP